LKSALTRGVDTEEKDLSIIIPLYNEEKNVQLLYELIHQAILPLEMRYEILFVDDGSEDATFDLAKKIAFLDNRVRVIKLRKNYGQTPAMAAGIDMARGKILVTMDGDLQNDPADIKELLVKIQEGNDIVCGYRLKRQDKLITKKIPSWIANWLIRKITGIPIKDNGCTFKAYRTDMIKKIPLYSDMHRFIPAMVYVSGAKISQIPVRHHARKFGKTNYGITRIYKILLDILMVKTILSLASRPMYMFASIGLFVGVFFMITLLLSIFNIIYRSDIPMVTVFGCTMMFGFLSMYFIFLRALCDLIYKTGIFKNTTLASICASFVNLEPKRKE
jgi:glycosyltransferase involved in cell wall biosynthesis